MIIDLSPYGTHEFSEHLWKKSDGGIIVPHLPKKWRYDRPIGIDFFAGCGGFSCGMHMAGFHMIAAVEMDYAAAHTYCTNLARPGVKFHFDTDERAQGFNKYLMKAMDLKMGKDGTLQSRKTGKKVLHTDVPTVGSGWIAHQPADEPGCEHFWLADVRNLTGRQILDELGLEVGEVDVVVGSPPCQGFSQAGKRDPNDTRNDLVFEFARLICEIQPKSMAFENVPGFTTMTTPEGIPMLDAFLQILHDGEMGTYEALRKSLLTSAGVGYMVKSRSKMNKKKAGNKSTAAPDIEEEDSTPDQLALEM